MIKSNTHQTIMRSAASERKPKPTTNQSAEVTLSAANALPRWCRVVQTRLHRRPEGHIDEDKRIVLPEAAHIAAKRRAMVSLPSGKLLECSCSVLVTYCTVLATRGQQLPNSIVHVEFLPDESMWCDEEVVAFFSLLHRDSLQMNAIEQSAVEPAWMALAKSLEVQHYIEFCVRTIQTRLLWQRDTQPEVAWKWMEAYRQHLDPHEWQRDCLEFLLRLDAANFKPYAGTEQRRQLQEMFVDEDILALVYSRWKQWGQGQHVPNSIVSKRVRIAWGTGTWRTGKLFQYDGQARHRVEYDDGTEVWTDLKLVTAEVDGHRVRVVSQVAAPSLEQCTLDRPPKPPAPASAAGNIAGDISAFSGKQLPGCMLLQIVVHESLRITCNYDVMEAMSPVVGEAVVDETTTNIATMHLPLAVSFPREEVVQFFELLHDRKPHPTVWKLSWVHLADHLQVNAWLDPMATWLWSNVSYGCFADWVVATRLQSMQQRKPEATAPTLTNEDVVARLVSETPANLTAVFLSADATRLLPTLGTDVLLDVVDRKGF